MILIWVIRFKNNLAELCHFFMKTSNSKIRKDNEKSWTNQKNWPWQAPWQIIFERFCLSPHIIVLNILVANSFDRKSTKYTLKSRQFYPFYVNLVTILCQFYVNFVPKGLHEFAKIFWTWVWLPQPILNNIKKHDTWTQTNPKIVGDI